jgi:hypothetical protein
MRPPDCKAKDPHFTGSYCMERKRISPRLKGALVVLSLVLATASIAYTAAQPKYSIQLIGTFWNTSQRLDSAGSGGQIGGKVVSYVAGDSEFVGSVVYIFAKNTTKLDTILTNYNKVAGVVMGGARTSFNGYADSASVGTLAATVGQVVYVLVNGRAWVTVDTQAGIAPGSEIIPSNRQGQRGRVAAKTTAIDSFYRAIGRIVDTGVIGTKRVANINIR